MGIFFGKSTVLTFDFFCLKRRIEQISELYRTCLPEITAVREQRICKLVPAFIGVGIGIVSALNQRKANNRVVDFIAVRGVVLKAYAVAVF